MKIAMIGQKQVPSREGGVEVAVEALSVRMASLGHDVTVYNRGMKTGCAAVQKTAHGTYQYKGIHIRVVPVIQRRGISAFTGSLFATLHALFCHYDCIHYHAEGPAAMAFLPHLFGIRTVVTIHGLDWQRSKWGRFASWYLRMGEKIAAAHADELIVLSHAAQEYFLDTYHRKTVYLPNGVEDAQLRAPDLIFSQWKLQKDSYLLYLGRIVPEKGLSVLLEAFRGVKTDKRLIIAGEASDTEDYARRMREMAAEDDRVQFVGFVKDAVLQELYTNCYLYCMPSEIEGMSLSLLDAMRYGCSCVCSDIPECTEVISDCGYTFPRGDSAALRRCLQSLCDVPEKVAESRERTQAHSFGRHNWDTVAEKTLELYRGIPDESTAVRHAKEKAE